MFSILIEWVVAYEWRAILTPGKQPQPNILLFGWRACASAGEAVWRGHDMLSAGLKSMDSV